MSISTEKKMVNLPALAAGRSGSGPERIIDIAPGPPLGSAALATLVGTARTLPLFYANIGATGDADRLAILADPQLSQRIATFIMASCSTPPVFSGEVLDLHPYWLAASVTIVEYRTIAKAPALPQAIGGFPLADVLVGAQLLAAATPPFDQYVGSLEHLMEVTSHAQ